MPELKYINHLGEEIKFDGKNYFINSCVMRDYAWNYENEFDKIKNFNTSGITSKTLSLSIHATSKSVAFNLFNSLYEIFEKDVLAQIPGKFYIGNYYFTCYITSSSKKEFWPSQNLLNLDLTVLSDTNTWLKASTYTFLKNQPVYGHGYAYKYPYRYSAGALKTFRNDSLINSNFKLIIYGPVLSPSIYVGGHLYSVNASLEANEYFEIDSQNKTVYKVQVDGTRVSALNFRNRDSYIFQKIPAGNVSVSWNNDFGFDLTIYDERSEPSWT